MRSINLIAREIKNDWKNVYFGASPYLKAMSSMLSVNDKYGLDDGKMVVRYFLANSSSWRGDVARRIKKELSDMVK
jgi:hypothetical protein